MENLVKLRTLIWDKDAVVWTDDELTDFLTEKTDDVYGTAAHVLRITMADPNRAQSYRLGGISKSLQDISQSILYYESLAYSGKQITCTVTRRNYSNETTKRSY